MTFKQFSLKTTQHSTTGGVTRSRASVPRRKLLRVIERRREGTLLVSEVMENEN